MAAAQREMAALQQMEAAMKKEEKEFTMKIDGLRAKLETCSRAHTAAEQRKARLEKERARIDKELSDTDAEITKQGALKQEITRSIVNMQNLRNEKDKGGGGESMPQAKVAAAPAQTGWGASFGGLASSWMGSAAPAAGSAPTKAAAPTPDLLGGLGPQAPVGVGAAASGAAPVDLLGGLSDFGTAAPPMASPPPPSAAPVDLLGGLGGFTSPAAPAPRPPGMPGGLPAPAAVGAPAFPGSADEFAGFDGFDAPPASMSAGVSVPPGGVKPPTDPFANLMM
uniref:Uncharacterized protein n=1 Tax=Haptolina brevifila TaxID=156173 RepID=A0A7S2D3H7_9EUKA